MIDTIHVTLSNYEALKLKSILKKYERMYSISEKLTLIDILSQIDFNNNTGVIRFEIAKCDL